ncbi:hypothetical protein [Microbaculum marinum]|uniref:Uncharacterized protein n=1 Tax=Microbaculum marinum TaxID=1764581 RepID=A0AAW9RLV6_9HYPH
MGNADNVVSLRPSANDNRARSYSDVAHSYEIGLHCDAEGRLLFATYPKADTAAAVRGMATDLESAARMLRDQAAHLDPDPEQDITVEIVITRSGTVGVAYDADGFETADRMTWLKDRLREAFRKITAP